VSRLRIFGDPISRSISNIWAALELGMDYEVVPIGWDDDSIYSEAYARINPNARVPALQDGDFVMWESLAINEYLVKKHGGPLAPKTLEEDALAMQWTLWCAIHLERPLMQFAFNTFILDPAERKAEVAAQNLKAAQPFLKVLDGAVEKTPYLLGDRFTLADLNVGCCIFRSHRGLDMTALPHMKAWCERVFTRPAAVKAWDIRVAAKQDYDRRVAAKKA
jgi:glutathione S-transferase